LHGGRLFFITAACREACAQTQDGESTAPFAKLVATSKPNVAHHRTSVSMPLRVATEKSKLDCARFFTSRNATATCRLIETASSNDDAVLENFEHARAL
jgi:hypothetical protein